MLNNDKLFRDFGSSLPHWKEDLKGVIERIEAEQKSKDVRSRK
jgi:hypothetical protein